MDLEEFERIPAHRMCIGRPHDAAAGGAGAAVAHSKRAHLLRNPRHPLRSSIHPQFHLVDEVKSESQRQAILDLLDYLERQSWKFQTTWEMRQDLKERGDRCLPTGCERLNCHGLKFPGHASGTRAPRRHCH